MSETLIDEHPQQRWHPFTRTAFRFAFVYLLLYNLPFPLNVFPYVDRRLANFFFLNRPTECATVQPLFRRTVWHRRRSCLRVSS